MINVENSDLSALHNELEFFAQIERESNTTQAALVIFNAAMSVKNVLKQGAFNRDQAVVKNAARIIRRLRDEMHYRKELLSISLFKEGIQLFFGQEALNKIYSFHFQQIEVQRKSWHFKFEPKGSVDLSGAIKGCDITGQLKCLTDEEMFITTIKATPDILEAIDLCRRALHDLKRVELDALSEGDQTLALRCISTSARVKENIHALSQINQNSSINYSVRILLNKEERIMLYAWLNSQPEYALMDELQHKAFN